jgi:plasmid stabilization system protein ParE
VTVNRTEATLADQPLLGATVPAYDDDSLREVFEDPSRIIDRVHDRQVDIVAVVHAARRPAPLEIP